MALRKYRPVRPMKTFSYGAERYTVSRMSDSDAARLIGKGCTLFELIPEAEKKQKKPPAEEA